ncbi:T9SS type A sorting domain-containing protein [Winogradskyella alexanderae]|uniref:T9SS type A sorting domain-containing protein n=1 Tax=Winogradskyella alexanderae TaxID=2877123 RepID=A0ABS7XPI5_9FLAO|nr:T9SS type A sorting domain-containing protein [Winogradskyella alexanderae]MCA0131929.1 T9SS type A sorting domain-containing protein [Winogradskyella alexanderae]
MRLILIQLVFWLGMSIVGAQNITTAEYYFNDNDLGLGLNTSFVISTASHTESIDISGLSDGFHDLHIRVFDIDGNQGAGAWSHYDRATFYIGTFLTGHNITDARYRIDNGINNPLGIGTPSMSISESYQIGIGSLAPGFHSLYIETQDSDGTWSHYDRITFFVSEFPSGQDIIAYRYRVDDGTTISGLETLSPGAPSITESFTVPVTGLSEGFHSFYVEMQVADGAWSLYDRHIFFISELTNMPSDIVAAEYFIDEDPGFGAGTPFDPTVMPLLAGTPNDITEGDHLLCVRVQNVDGVWSLYNCATFNVDSTLGADESLYKSITVNPNPFKDTIDLEMSRQVEFELISVFDLTGKIVFKSSDNLRRLDLGHLDSGTYILSLQSQIEKATFKIIKE